MPRLLLGHVLDALKLLPDNSVHCCVTSPPYWGLRTYNTAAWVGGDPLCAHKPRKNPRVESSGLEGGKATTGHQQKPVGSVCPHCGAVCEYTTAWGGDPACRHVWGPPIITDHRGTQIGKASTVDQRETPKGQFCRRCGAWLGELGAEPTPEMYVQHLVEVFREVRRVLRPNGSCWIVLGDSYAGGNYRGGAVETSSAKQRSNTGCVDFMGKKAPPIPPGLKAKDLVGIPWAVAFALWQDGWWLRSAIPWIKRNALCESVRDRPTSAVEYVFLLAKSARPYFDMEAIKIPSTQPDRQRADQFGGTKHGGHSTKHSDGSVFCGAAKRHRRNSDWFFESWQGLYEEDGEPLAFIVNTTAFKGAHFATFPPKLIEPMVLAGTSEHGYCPECGAPWRRITRKVDSVRIREGSDTSGAAKQEGATGRHGDTSILKTGEKVITETVGWQPSCVCHSAVPPKPRPCLVLDPFMGSGTTAQVCEQLGRDWIGIELQPSYVPLIEKRLDHAVVVECVKGNETEVEL